MNEKLKKRIMLLIGLGIQGICFFICLYNAAYSVVSVDDFNLPLGSQECDSILEIINTVLWNVKYIYFTHQGTYSGVFYAYFFQILMYKGWINLSFVMFVSSAFLLFSLYVSMQTYFDTVGFQLGVETKMLIEGFILFAFLSYMPYIEIFTWLSGYAVYGMPIACALLSITLVLRDNNHKIWFVLACILCFLGMGGALVVTAYFMVMSVLCIIVSKRDLRQKIIYIVIMLACACVNAISPGNFVRHEYYDNTVNVLKALRDCIFTVSKIGYHIALRYEIWLMIIVIVISSIKYYREHFTELIWKRTIISTLFLIACPFIVSFPCNLGYASAEVADRVQFIIIISIMQMIIYLSIFVGKIVSKIGSGANIVTKMLNVICVFCICFCLYDIHNNNVAIQLSQIVQGKVALYHRNVNICLNTIKNSKEINVYVRNFPNSVYNLKSVGVEYDMDGTLKKWIADYYGKENVFIEFEE